MIFSPWSHLIQNQLFLEISSSLHSWIGKVKAPAQCYEKPKLKLKGIWTWMHGLDVHMQATEILCPLKLCEMSGLPGKKPLLISLPNTIGRSPIFSSVGTAPFKTGTEFSVGLLTIRFFPENVSRTSSSAVLLLQPSLEDLCNGREKGSSAEKGIECQNCQICPVTSSHPMTCFLCGWWGFLRGWW